MCKRCKAAGAKSLVPYKIIEDKGDSVKFIGQLCQRCFDEIFAGPPETKDENDKQESKE